MAQHPVVDKGVQDGHNIVIVLSEIPVSGKLPLCHARLISFITFGSCLGRSLLGCLETFSWLSRNLEVIEVRTKSVAEVGLRAI